MKYPRWFNRMLTREGRNRALAASKHERGKQPPRGWRRKLRVKRKRQRQARLAHRR